MTLLSIFGGGLWIVLLLCFGGSIAFYITGKKTKDNSYYVPAVLAALVGLAFLYLMIADK